MRDLPHSWDEHDDRALRSAAAVEAIGLAADIKASEGWKSVVAALIEEESDLLEALARSSKEDEQNRGAIRALRHVRALPDRLIRAAEAELSKHRGT